MSSSKVKVSKGATQQDDVSFVLFPVWTPKFLGFLNEFASLEVLSYTHVERTISRNSNGSLADVYIRVNNGCFRSSIADGLSFCLPSRHLSKTSLSAGFRFSGMSGGHSAQAIYKKRKARQLERRLLKK